MSIDKLVYRVLGVTTNEKIYQQTITLIVAGGLALTNW